MYLFWALLVLLVVVLILFWILPNLMAPEKQDGIVFDVKKLPPPPEVIEQQKAQQMLAAQYEPAREIVPEDFPPKSIGDCPYSKPMSTNLPMANIPMYILTDSATCTLNGYKK